MQAADLRPIQRPPARSPATHRCAHVCRFSHPTILCHPREQDQDLSSAPCGGVAWSSFGTTLPGRQAMPPAAIVHTATPVTADPGEPA